MKIYNRLDMSTATQVECIPHVEKHVDGEGCYDPDKWQQKNPTKEKLVANIWIKELNHQNPEKWD